MTMIEAVISGIVQGVTEFLPVSSSGHLVLIHGLFGLSGDNVFFDICLHAATLLAILVFFRKDIAALIRERNARWLLYLGVGTVPAVLAGLLYEERISEMFSDPSKTSVMLLVTGAVLFAAQAMMRRADDRGRSPSTGRSLLVGAAQALALLPGISRSGMTVAAGLFCGMKRTEAFRFSFLLAVPVISGATLYKALTLPADFFSGADAARYGAGMTCAFLTGMGSLYLFGRILEKGRLYVFGCYCLIVGVVGMFLYK